MRAVWSFWHKPFSSHRVEAWGSERSHLLAWALSFERARQHYPHTTLVTDDEGAHLLVDGLGLEFDEVSLGVNLLRTVDASWWTAGKLVAIAEQAAPFIHLDPDVFLWKPLPAATASAPVFAQNPEPFVPGGPYYRPEDFETVLGAYADAWLPEEWRWYRSPGAVPRGECCGVVGGTNVGFLRHYARQGLRLLMEVGNQVGLGQLTDRSALTITLEQYLLSACIEHHRNRTGSPYGSIEIAYLFLSWRHASYGTLAAERGYTHLIADTKRSPKMAERIEARLAADHPIRYERCLAFLEKSQSPVLHEPTPA